MMKPVPVRSSKMASSVALAFVMMVGGGSLALAQPALPPPPPPYPYPAAPAVPPAEAPPAPPAVTGTSAAPAAAGATDHDSVVGLWGIQARRIESFARTQGEDKDCPAPCRADLNSVSVRKWVSPKYAYTVGLAMAVGGGSRYAGTSIDSETETLDTFFGVGPTFGASFLLANWKHLSVSLNPELDLVYFLPSGKGAKSMLVNVRGVVEGEIHLGMIGLPQASVGISTGLLASYLHVSRDEKMPLDGATASRFSIGLSGPRSLWDLVTNATLRYYF
jgi:hypothetical protein